jgi:thioredoxin reductase (NADPH)
VSGTEQFDVAVVGGGPAGAAAAIACARGGARVVLLEPMTVGGEAMNVPEVEELPETGTAAGPDLVASMTERVMTEGVDLRLGETAGALERDGGGWRIDTDMGAVAAPAVVLATGAAPLALDGTPVAEEGLHEGGLFTCASCDAPLYSGRRVAIAGGGDTGAGAALLLSEYASEVLLYEREQALTCQAALARRLAGVENVELRLGCEVVGTVGGAAIEEVSVHELGSVRSEPAEGLMVAVGMRPRSDLVAAHAELDAAGAVVVGADLASSAPGLFAAGDVRTGAAWRCAAAWGDGLTAARSVMRSAVAGRG